MKNVLVIPCSGRGGIELNRALGRIVHFRLWGADELGMRSQGDLIYKNYLGEFNLYNEEDIEKIKQAIDRYEIDMIYPASMEAMSCFAHHQCSIPAIVVSSPEDVIKLCRSPIQIFDIVKNILEENPDVEILSASCLSDRHGCLKFARDDNFSSPELVTELATIINSKIALRGVWSFSIKMGEVHITLGISPQMAVCRSKGVNLAALSLFDHMGHDIEVRETDIDISSYSVQQLRCQVHYDYDDVYFDLDETIIIRDQVNEMMMSFLFQCRNRGKRVHLITKHRHDLHTTLEKFKLSSLFDSIIWLKHSDEKFRYMKKERAIFIDDAYSERRSVAENIGIPTFEVSAVECLIDWRL
ncbi:HAD family hydrolase [Cohnella fermenti]|uniref:HAD family hydrolase n=1 Tax=Cohnella fermenti TaxID=2565925 RepID=A0A4S4C003_9BACL|nr:HAD family hydrolase [Cohnella fermenti]THF80783.1 HAD family hydrolase [Cohnella fermenti]